MPLKYTENYYPHVDISDDERSELEETLTNNEKSELDEYIKCYKLHIIHAKSMERIVKSGIFFFCIGPTIKHALDVLNGKTLGFFHFIGVGRLKQTKRSFGNFLKSLLGVCVVGILVRMKLDRLFSIGFLDFFGAGFPGNSQEFVIIFLGHAQASFLPSGPLETTTPAGRTRRSCSM